MTEIPLFDSRNEEYRAVLEVNGFDPDTPREEADPWVETHTQIVALFTTVNPNDGSKLMISRSRMAAIPAITARRQQQVWRARGELSREDLLNEWRGNTPDPYGRHPDLLFDMAQYNFGHDGPIDHIERSVMISELRRRELIKAYRIAIRRFFERRPGLLEGEDY